MDGAFHEKVQRNSFNGPTERRPIVNLVLLNPLKKAPSIRVTSYFWCPRISKIHTTHITIGGIYGVSKMRILEGHRIVALTIVRATI